MNFALFLLLPVSAAANLTPPAPPAGVKTYEAILATETPPAVKDLAKPAVFIRDGSAKAIVGEPGTGWIV